MTDYSQTGEQAIIARAIAAAGVDRGRCLDVGAYHASVFSHSRPLIEAGWSALLVEPHPAHAGRLRDAYAGHGGVDVLVAAIVPNVGWPGVAWMAATDDMTSTLLTTFEARWEAAGTVYTGRIPVACVPIEDVCGLAGPFDVVSIDAEGLSYGIADSLLRQGGDRPAVIVVEADGPGERDALVRLARSVGYALAGDTANNVVLAR